VGPCLCGDTACPSCHPEGQTHLSCPDCGWAAKSCEAGFESDEDSDFDIPGACPDCGGTLVAADLEEIDPEDEFNQEPNAEDEEA